MEEKILNIIKSHNKALTYEEIFTLLNEEEQKELAKILINLENELKIRVTNKGKYELFNDKNTKIGTLVSHPKGFGFVVVDGQEKDYYISKEHMNGAINGDVVVISVINEPKYEAVVRKVTKRNLNDLLVGEFYVKDGKNFVKLDDEKLNIIVEIKDAKTAVEGHKIVVKVENKISQTNYYQGTIIRVLGHKNDPGVDILSIAAKYGITDLYPEEVTMELDDVPTSVSKEDKKGRRDLTDEVIFTIDGDDTKDIDDAISIEKFADGTYELGVHIADVSYYVKENTALGDEAYNRGTSVYLADTVIPMLPHTLSNGICSLNPGVERLAISCVMKIDENGKTTSSEIFESVIKSRKQMTYKNVNMILEKNTVPEGYQEFAEKLLLMKELSSKIRKQKVNKGYIDFEIDEPKIIVNDKGVAVDIKKRERGTGEKLIEDFMISANEAVASTIAFMDLPFVYRIHGLPSEEKIQNFLNFLNVLGYKVNANLKNITPKTIQNILSQLKDKEEYSILSAMMLRSMQKAVYDVNNIGHFGLASKYYTHFTSPIRRFPDLTVHRLLRTYLFKNKINSETVNYYTNKLPEIAKHSSERERAAVECERDVDDMKMAEYMLSHIGEVFTGTINTVANFGFYVELPNLVEGLVRIDSLDDDYYFFEENSFSLIGRSTKKRYMLGNKVTVIVDNVNKDKGQIDFKVYKGKKNGNKQ